jgi:hypothetical protein
LYLNILAPEWDPFEGQVSSEYKILFLKLKFKNLNQTIILFIKLSCPI